MTKICLNMIVKNESKNILRCLKSVAPLIDLWNITDTGSTDGTQSLICGFFSKRNIAGTLNTARFENFSQARNKALANTEAQFDFDYHLLVDADMQWIGDFDKDDLVKNAYALLQQDVKGKAEWWNTRLVRRGIGARYIGVTHEYLHVNGPPAVKRSGGRFLDWADGANRPGKFKRDIDLLKAELEKNPNDARSMFYLAQSYRDDSQLEWASGTYARRARMVGTWEEERWYAELMHARCLMSLGYGPAALDGLLRVHRQRPWRREPLRDLARYYAAKADAITDTEDDVLFVEP